jgi:malonyl-CoA O-methyltransferase
MSFSKNMVWSPLDYVKAAVLAREVSEELLSRLDWMTLNPSVIVDVGCGTGEMSSRLHERYAEAKVLAVDLSDMMIQHAKQNTTHVSCICADAGKLPLQNQSVDLLFANFLIPWHDDIASLLREWRRVLRPNGLLILTALGLDTLKEWRTLFPQACIPKFVDMHDAGDLMLQEGFDDPVLDVNHYTITYRDQTHLLHELHVSGMLNEKLELTKSNDMAFTDEGTWAVTYEVVFAHAFVPAQSDEISASSDGTVRVPLAYLRRRLGS